MNAQSIDLEVLLAPYLNGPLSPEIYSKFQAYLDLLLRWNAKMNLTAVREPETIVTRHFGESLALAQHLPPFETLLDFGSGAGFPGIPIQLLYPEAKITLAESQHKKASFLREAIRTLELSSEVWAGRVEGLAESRRFDIVTMRAVDNMEAAVPAAISRLTPKGTFALLAGTGTKSLPQGLLWADPVPIPNTEIRIILGKH